MTSFRLLDYRLSAADLFGRLTDGSLMPHGYCRRWDTALIERHGGRIWFGATPVNGATFHFTLPDNPCRLTGPC